MCYTFKKGILVVWYGLKPTVVIRKPRQMEVNKNTYSFQNWQSGTFVKTQNRREGMCHFRLGIRKTKFFPVSLTLYNVITFYFILLHRIYCQVKRIYQKDQ